MKPPLTDKRDTPELCCVVGVRIRVYLRDQPSKVAG